MYKEERIENHYFAAPNIIIDFGKDHQIDSKTLHRVKSSWATGYSHSLKLSPHRFHANYKGGNVHLQWENLAVTRLNK